MSLYVRARALGDTLLNFVSGLGTPKDPRSATRFVFNELNRQTLEQMYRSDWLARRIVDLPAEDATREWRQWTGDRQKLEKIDLLEKKLDIQKKTRQALQRARLYGGSALVLGVDQGQPEEELDLDEVGLNDLKFVVVVNRYELSAGPRIFNVDSAWYTRPEYYTVSTPMFGFFGEEGGAYPTGTTTPFVTPQWEQGQAPPQPKAPGLSPDKNRQVQPNYGMIRMHPSRVIEFTGNELPDWRLAPLGGGWGDSVLQTMDDALRDFAMIVSGLASMINDMKMDVVKIPDLSRKLSTDDITRKTLERFGLANMAKSSINTLLLDKEEDWARIQTSFGSTPDLIKVAMTIACAAGGVPESRIMGNAPNKGLASTGNSGGEVDIRNYYDDIASKQKSQYKPMMMPLDRCLQQSALGKYDPAIDYNWNPLYQPTAQEQAAMALAKAQTTQVYVTTGLINEDALREAVISQLTEDAIYPGLEDAIDEFGSEPEEPPAPMQPVPPNAPPGMMPKGQFEANPFHMLRANQQAKQGQQIRVPPNRKAGPQQYQPVPPGAQQTKDEWVEDEDYTEDFNPYHDPHTGEFATGEGEGAAHEGGGGVAGPGGNYGLVPGDVAKFHALKSQWAQVNNELLAHIDEPDSPETEVKMRELERIVHQMHALHADPGGPEGIGLPGGPRDVTIVGAGPGGMTAAIGGGTEGLDTLVIEGNAVAGGQAKFSSRIENFPGYPIGVPGERLSQDMLKQVEQKGAETKLGVRVTGLRVDADGMKHLTLSNGEVIDSRAVILAGGVEFKKMTFPGSDGPGVVVADGASMTKLAAGGEAVVLGGSNGAAQAALGAAGKAAHVTLISRSPITKGMSDYQVEALRNQPKVTVIEGDNVASLERGADGMPKSITTAKGQHIPVKALGIFVGNVPQTDWLPPEIRRDESGRVLTDADLMTGIPGVYAIGDMKAGAIGRIGVAVGEGQLALRHSWGYLDSLRKKAAALPAARDALNEDDDQTDDLITRLFALDRANPWFGQTIEGVKAGRRGVDASPSYAEDFNPYHDPKTGRFVSSEEGRKQVRQRGTGAVASALGESDLSVEEMAKRLAPTHQAVQQVHHFMATPAVKAGIGATVAAYMLRATTATAHEAAMHVVKGVVEDALGTVIGTVAAHIVAVSGAAAGASLVPPIVIGVAAGLAVKTVAHKLNFNEETSHHLIGHSLHYLHNHYHALKRGVAAFLAPVADAPDAAPAPEDEEEGDVVLAAIRALLPYFSDDREPQVE